MIIFSIDPGTEKSAWLVLETRSEKILGFGIDDNEKVIALIDSTNADHLVVEKMKSYGNIIGDSVLETCVWIGRFVQTWAPKPFTLLTRKEIVVAICNNSRAKDKNVRQALIDRFGGKLNAVGKKGAKGPLYGIKRDIWSALAIALTFSDAFGDMVH